jgi:hypothetical protein
MNKKELNRLAREIAEAEYVLQNSTDENELKKAKKIIFHSAGKVKSMEEMIILDEIIQSILSEKT